MFKRLLYFMIYVELKYARNSTTELLNVANTGEYE